MKHIVLKYLNKNYMFTVKTCDTFVVKDIISGQEVKLTEVFKTLEPIFSIEQAQLINIYDKWFDEQITLINNRAFEIQLDLYTKGYDLSNNRW